jgi:hypothetical protein
LSISNESISCLFIFIQLKVSQKQKERLPFKDSSTDQQNDSTQVYSNFYNRVVWKLGYKGPIAARVPQNRNE